MIPHHMNETLKNWEASGEYLFYSAHKHRIFIKQIGNAQASADNTLLLLHGFPESSYSYHAVIDGLLKRFDRIIVFDMIGYGLSDKPVATYSYSLMEQADTAFQVWKHFGIKGGHLLAHDMGNSVATEILTRHEHDMLPSWFSAGLKSVTFTNGSIVLELAKLRITQKILLTRFGYLLGKVVSYRLFSQQVRSAHGNGNLSEAEIQTLWQSNVLQNGQQKSYLTIKYILDRRKFEKTRWLPALSQTKLPIHLCWGNDDQVARVAMAYHLKQKICTDATLTIMEGVGHFGQLGSPEIWVKSILAFYQ